MTSSFSDKGWAAVLNWPAEISHSEILDCMRTRSARNVIPISLVQSGLHFGRFAPSYNPKFTSSLICFFKFIKLS